MEEQLSANGHITRTRGSHGLGTDDTFIRNSSMCGVGGDGSVDDDEDGDGDVDDG